MSNVWVHGLIILAVLFLVPIIMSLLNKYFRKGFPVNKEISNALLIVDKNKILKKKMEHYSKSFVIVGILLFSVFVVFTVILFGNIYSSKHGDNYMGFFAMFPLIISGIAPFMMLSNVILKKLFESMNPKIDSKLFEIYSAYYSTHKGFSYSRNVNALELNRKSVIISLAVFIPSLILCIVLAII